MASSTETTSPVIAHVLHRLYLAGAEVLAADLSRKLRHRYRFIFLCLDEVGPLGLRLRNEGFTVLDLQRKPGVDLSVARRIAGAVAQHGIQLLHAHQYTPFFYAAASRLPPAKWSLAGPSILFTEHGRHYPDVRRPKRVLANRLLLRKRDRVTAVGQWVRQCLIDNEGLPGKRIEVVLNGIDPRAFAGDDATKRASLRRELAVNDGDVVILQVARFHPVKDHATALRAFAHALQSPLLGALAGGTKPVLVLAGDGEQRHEMATLAHALKIDDKVRFLGVRSDVADLLAAADVFMLSSLSEGVSVTLLEAMAAGLSIAATKVGGNPEVVADGVTGLLAPRREAATLGNHLATLIADPDLRQRMGQAGRQRLRAMFTQQRMHERYAAIYEAMLGGGSSLET